MFCKYCGRQIYDNANFCNYCGNALNDDVQQLSENENTGSKLNKKAVATALVGFVIVGCAFVVIYDKLKISDYEKKLNTIYKEIEDYKEIEKTIETTTAENTTVITTETTTAEITTTITTETEKVTTVATTETTEIITQKEVPVSKPCITFSKAEVFRFSGYEGTEVHLSVDGDFSYINVKILCDYEDFSNYSRTLTKEECKNYITFDFNAVAQPYSYFVITPFNENDIPGDVVKCDMVNNGGVVTSGGLSYAVSNMKGQINCHGGTVAGFTTNYVVNGGAVGKVRSSLGDKWHITAKNVCYNYGVVWYELWDSDDGDYYGWVDENYIDFY